MPHPAARPARARRSPARPAATGPGPAGCGGADDPQDVAVAALPVEDTDVVLGILRRMQEAQDLAVVRVSPL
ncbi:hypothetical protein [Cellulomonas marina]|uniref:Uncharacterized protein n=1 Tax=Cellulomonas marina TaxID=988821 RepID=A0A1I0Y3J7_9CELL|nr:hypothetical protein [Cellulomonas marina]GIG29778.1 hypothetical protein Cma02nite_23780 [Cellulomonas marina]SFB07925.1 hypothetical protein SAMN05421867_106161 [Cellulomonas marina]